MEDVLVQVDKFYFPVDFIILDTQPVLHVSTQIPIILSQPFLTTSNALIHCRNGIMKFSFGNMTLELNVFNIAKQPREDEELHEVNCVELLTQNLFENACTKKESHALESVQNDESVDMSVIEAWSPKFEKLLPAEPKSVKPSVEVIKP